MLILIDVQIYIILNKIDTCYPSISSKREIEMVTCIQKLVKGVVSFINDAPISPDEKTHLQHYSVFLVIGIPAMVFYGLKN